MKYSFRDHHLFQILKQFSNQHLPLDLFLSRYFRFNKALGSKDRAQVSEAVYGMTRWRSLLNYLTDSEESWESKYAVYKNFQPNQYLYVNSIPLHTRISFPEELFTLLLDQYGEEKALRLCQICNTPAPITIRINPRKTTRSALIEKLQKNYDYDVTPCEISPLGIQCKRRFPFPTLPEYQEGLFEVQDEGSQLISELVQPKPGDQVLDYCAGAGGKSLAFAHHLEGEGQLYLHDIRPFAISQAKKRIRRAGIQNVQFLLPGHPQLQKLKKAMDWVVVDAPCSGSGILRRNPDMKWKFSLEMLRRLVTQQRNIFEQALSFLKPGGKIVYATCSLLQQENEAQIEHFCSTYSLQPDSDPFCSLPSFGGMDGFYALRLK